MPSSLTCCALDTRASSSANLFKKHQLKIRKRPNPRADFEVKWLRAPRGSPILWVRALRRVRARRNGRHCEDGCGPHRARSRSLKDLRKERSFKGLNHAGAGVSRNCLSPPPPPSKDYLETQRSRTPVSQPRRRSRTKGPWHANYSTSNSSTFGHQLVQALYSFPLSHATNYCLLTWVSADRLGGCVLQVFSVPSLAAKAGSAG